MPLKESLLRSVKERGFTEPTEIQERAISALILSECDFVGQAQTGTGKTAAFALPLLQKVDDKDKNIQAIILSPTRELANQTCEEIRKFSTYEKVKSFPVYGGVPIDNQIRNIRKMKPQIIVGTPGRVLDLIRRKVLNLGITKYAVLDEADEMLDMGFLDDVQEILSSLGKHSTWMFSATMPAPIMGLIKKYLQNPEIVKIKKKTLSNENIQQKFFVVRENNMKEAICRILDSIEDYYGIIFTRTKLEAKSLTDELNARGHLADSLHGDMDQKNRDLTMKRFKQKKVQLLVCTDVAARGIDVDNLSHVINYGLPQDLESYVHRIGRTGRAGLKGEALSIISPSEQKRLRSVENLTNAKIAREKIPSVELLKDSMVKRMSNQFEFLLDKVEEENFDDSFDFFSNIFEGLEKEDVLKLMFMQLFSQKMKKLEAYPDVDFKQSDRSFSSAPVGTPNRYGDIRFFMNAGREDGIDLNNLIQMISSKLKIEAKKIRNVQVKDRFSFLEVPASYKKLLLDDIDISIGRKRVRFEPTKESRSFSSGGSGSGYRRSYGPRNTSGGGYSRGTGQRKTSDRKVERNFNC